MLGPQREHMLDSENVIKEFPSLPRHVQIIISQPAVQVSDIYTVSTLKETFGSATCTSGRSDAVWGTQRPTRFLRLFLTTQSCRCVNYTVTASTAPSFLMEFAGGSTNKLKVHFKRCSCHFRRSNVSADGEQ